MEDLMVILNNIYLHKHIVIKILKIIKDGKKKYNDFVIERLLNKKKSLSETISGNNFFILDFPRKSVKEHPANNLS